MLKTHEIAFKLSAFAENSFPKTFANVNNMMNGVKTHLDSMRKLQNPFIKMNGNAVELAKAFELAKAKNEVLNNSFRNSQSKTDKLRNAYNQAQQKCKDLHLEIKNSIDPTKKQIDGFRLAIAQSDRLKQKWNEARQESRSIRSELKLQADTVKNLGDAYQHTSKRRNLIEKANEYKKNIGLSLQNAANSAAVARNTIGMANFMSSPIKAAIKFESVMADVRKLVHFDTPQEFAEMGEQIKQLSLRLPIAADGLAHIAAAAAQAGIHKKDIMQFTENAAQMAVAYNITAEEAGDMMAKWRSAFSLTQEQVVKLSDQVNTLSDNTAATGVEIGDVVTRIGSLGEIAGVTQSQLAALAATSIGGGFKSEQAATGIKKLFTVLTSGTAVTKSQIEAFTKLRINTVQLSKDIRDKGAPAILNVLEKIKQLPKYEQVSMIKRIFGEEAIGPVAALANNLEQVKVNLNLVGDASNYAGSVLKEFNARSATTENTMQLFKNQLAAISITIGDTFLPAINDIMKGINKTLQESVLPFISAHKDAIKTLGKLAAELIIAAAGISVFKAAIETLKIPLMVANGLLKGMWKALLWFIPATQRAAMATKLQAFWQGVLNTVMKANPIIKVISVIMALGGALYYLCTHWDDVVAGAKKAWEMVKNFASSIMEIVKAIASLFDGNDGKKKIDVEYQLTGSKDNSSRFNGNIEALATQNKMLKNSNQNITYNAPQTITVNSGDPDAIKQAASKSSKQAQTDFNKWYDNGIRFAP